MTQQSRFLPIRDSFEEWFANGRARRRAVVALPLLLAVVMGLTASVFIARGDTRSLVILLVLVPVALLLLKYPLIVVIAWLAVFPLFLKEPSGAGYLMYWALHRLLPPAALIVAVLTDWFRFHKREPVRFGAPELMMLFFITLTVVNIVLLGGGSPIQTLVRFYDRSFVPFIMYWIVRLSAPTEDDYKRLVPFAWIMLVFQCVIGLLSWFAPEVVPPQWAGLSGERTVGTLGNVAVYTVTLIFLSMIVFHYGMQSRSRWVRWLMFATLSLAFFCVFFSFSRGSWLGGSLVLLGLLFLYPKVVFRIAVVVVALVLLLGNSVLADEIQFAIERLNEQDTAQGRVIGSMASIRMIEEKPVFGWGYGNYDVYDEQFKERVGGIAVQEGGTSHNTPLTIMVELGATGYILYILPAIIWLLRSIAVRRRMPQQGLLSRPLLVMLWLALLHHFTVTNFMDMFRFHVFGITIWWMALGLIGSIVAPHLAAQPTWNPVSDRPSTRLIELGR